MIVRIAFYQGDEFGWDMECPESASLRMVVNFLVSRGWTEIGVGNDGKIRLVNGGGNYHATVEEMVTV